MEKIDKKTKDKIVSLIMSKDIFIVKGERNEDIMSMSCHDTYELIADILLEHRNTQKINEMVRDIKTIGVHVSEE